MNLLITDSELDAIDAMSDAELGRLVRIDVERYRAKIDAGDSPAGRSVAEDRAFTVTADTALRAATEQRIAADHAREMSPLARLIPHYGRLP